MFKNRSLKVKFTKDTEGEETSPLVEAINHMTPEQLDQLQKKLMRQMAINIGGIIVAKVAIAIILNAIVRKLENQDK